MNVTFLKKTELTEEQLKFIRTMYRISFDVKEDIGFLDETVIGLAYYGKKIIGMSFLLFPTKEHLNSTNSLYQNIKQQGVTEKDCYIYNFCIVDTERKKGFGKALLQHLHEYIKKSNINMVLLFVESENVPAVCLYNKAGYKVHIAGLSGFVMNKII